MDILEKKIIEDFFCLHNSLVHLVNQQIFKKYHLTLNLYMTLQMVYKGIGNINEMRKFINESPASLGKKINKLEMLGFVTRSLNSEYSVLSGICTHLGCSPKYHPEVEPKPWDSSWNGGFFCPCHGSMFDLVGRVYKGVPAPSNLTVPPHFFEGSILTIGEERSNV